MLLCKKKEIKKHCKRFGLSNEVAMERGPQDFLLHPLSKLLVLYFYSPLSYF